MKVALLIDGDLSFRCVAEPIQLPGTKEKKEMYLNLQFSSTKSNFHLFIYTDSLALTLQFDP